MSSSLNPRSECQTCKLGIAAAPKACPFQNSLKEPGCVLQFQDELPSRVWYVREGRVALGSFNGSGDEQACAVRGPGSVIGAEALLDAPAEHQAWAVTATSTCSIDVEAFRHWVGALDSPVGAILELVLSEASLRSRERRQLSGSPVRRVARALVARLGPEGTLELAITQRMLARAIGIRHETLSRAVSELRREGALSPGRGIRVADVAVLRRIADI